MQYIIFFISFFVFTMSVNAQTAIQTYNWKTYTSFNSVTTILEIQDELWVGTKGGIIVYDTSGKQLRSFTTANGLLELSVSTIFYDEKSGSVFVGYENGIIDVYRNGSWSHITDILDASKQYPNRRVNGMVSREDTLYVATAFGLVFFDTRTLTPLGQLDKFVSLPSLTAVNRIAIWKNELFALTPKLLLKISLQNTSLLSLQIANNWSIVQETGFLKDTEIFNQMKVSNQYLYLANNHRVYRFDGMRIETIHNDSVYIIQDLQILPDTNVLVYTNFYIRLAGSSSNIYFSHNEQNIPIGRIACGIYTKDAYFVGFQNTGFGKVLATNSFNLFQNDGIISNTITSIGIDSKSAPWIATGGNPAGFGFSYKLEDRWKFYEKVNTPFIRDNVYDNVSALENGEVWLSSFGVGTVRAIPTDSGYDLIRYDNTNSPLVGAVDSDPNYVITGQTCLDFSGNRFVINRYTKGGPLFCVLTPSNEWKTFGESIIPAENYDYNEVQMDRFGTFWVKSANRFQQNGILFFNYNRTLDNKSDDKWGTLKTLGSNIPNPTAMAVDDNSVVWVGTSTGLWRISNTSAILQDKSPTITRSLLLSNITINHIAVDAINQKWVSTNEGIWVLNEDGTEVVQILTTSNSPLISNVISTIGIDKKNGIVYVGTSIGLQSFETPIVTPADQFSLDCYPSPFVIRQHPFMTINGLEIDSEVRIVTSSGTLVKFYNTTSGSLNWDGKDMNGQYVASGIYIVSARSGINNTTSVKKIFVKNNIHGG